MPESIEFEWQRLKQGYALERLNSDWLTFGYDHEEKRDLLLAISKVAPQWVRQYVKQGEYNGDNMAEFLADYPYGDHYLVPRGDETERYRPLEEHPALFMEFSDRTRKPEGAAKFISDFGAPFAVKPNEILDPTCLMIVLNENRSMCSLVKAWERYQDTGRLSPLLKTFGNMRGHSFGQLKIGLRESAPTGEILMTLAPDSLYSAMLLQLVQAITKGFEMRQCDECLSWFEVAPGRSRPEKRYCSNACSMRAYRKRKAGKK